MTAFEIIHHSDGPATRVDVRGELDVETGPRLDELLRRLEREAPTTLVLDLHRVTFFDSTGLQIVLDTEVRARETGRRFVVVPGDGEPRRVLELADVASRLELQEPAG